jgi:hypothetical protein
MKTKLLLCLVSILTSAGCAKQQSQTTDENVDVVKIYNIVILDRSASMSPLREAAVQGYNGILEVVRNAQEQNALAQQNYITLSFFNDSVTNVFDCDTIQSISDLLLDDYRPQGNTALWDAIGVSLDSLKTKLDSLENATAVVTIISDGLENASKHYSIYAVADRIDALKGQGVMFVFMGTNQDVTQTAASLHIDNFRVFEYTAEGMKKAWQSGIDASADYYERMSQYNKDTKGMSKQERNDYYSDRNKEDGWFK